MEDDDPHQKTRVELRSREWTCVGVTELHVLQEMAEALRAISKGRVPSGRPTILARARATRRGAL